LVPNTIERSTYVLLSSVVLFLMFWHWRTMPVVLFGLRQVYLAWREKPYTDVEFRASLLYQVVRHPLLLGLIVAFWATPTMTAGHLLFAVATTGYVLIAIQWEEHDLSATLGDRYRDYRSRVPMLIPGLHRRRQRTLSSGTARRA
jgi:methanethiol S-methyltransferase